MLGETRCLRDVQVCRIIWTRLENREHVQCTRIMRQRTRNASRTTRYIVYQHLSNSSRFRAFSSASHALLSCFCKPCIQDSRNNLLDCHIRHAGTVRTHNVQGDLFYCRLGLACEGRSFFAASMWKYDLERSNESNANSTKQSIVPSIKNFLLAIGNCICMKSYLRSDFFSILFSYESNKSSWS